MSERERFEAWARQRWTHPEDFDAPIKDPGKYNNYEAQAAWDAWQEKAAQNVASVPSDILYRLGAAHDACLDEDHRECRDIIMQLMREIGPDGAVPEPEVKHDAP